MDGIKGYLQSRTLWSNVLTLISFGLVAAGRNGFVDVGETTDQVAQFVTVGGIVLSTFFRAIAKKELVIGGSR